MPFSILLRLEKPCFYNQRHEEKKLKFVDSEKLTLNKEKN